MRTLYNIELTEVHKFKLLEMCEVLFIEKIFSLGVNNKICNGWSNSFLVCSDIKSMDVDIIHWFEFCMTYLVEKILNPEPNKPNRTLKDDLLEFFWNTNIYWDATCNTDADMHCKIIHPIDYLYDKFLCLKK